jgi:hypothetical protein
MISVNLLVHWILHILHVGCPYLHCITSISKNTLKEYWINDTPEMGAHIILFMLAVLIH